MTQDEIIRMAREAGMEANEDNGYLEWWNFAKLVAAHVKSDQIQTAYQQGCEDMKRRMEKRMQQLESQLQLCQTAVADEREACAKWCEQLGALNTATPQNIAAAIRARGEK